MTVRTDLAASPRRRPRIRSRADDRRAARRDQWAADLLGAAAIASIVVVFFIWIQNEGLDSLLSLDRALSSLGLITGLLSANLMLVQTVMLARIPWVERAWGHDLLAHRHKLAGYWSFWLMIAHVVLFAIQRVQREPAAALDALAHVFVLDSWMLWATIGTLMIVGVVVTSIVAARRRLRYESWHLLHLYAYLGMAFALPHMIADGTDFHSVGMQVYWWSIYGLTLGAILFYRVFRPVARSLHHRLRVESVALEGQNVVTIVVGGRDLDAFRTRSGQFFIWRFLGSKGWTRGHPYTISAAPTDDRLRVTIQAVGDGSARAMRVRPGDRVIVEGPYGTMTSARRTRPRMLLMAAGVGITPLRALLEDTDYRPGEADLIYRYRDADHLILGQELDLLASERGATVHYSPGNRRADGAWRSTEDPAPDDVAALRALVPDVAERDAYLCGPEAWLKAATRALRAAGVPARRIHTEIFAW